MDQYLSAVIITIITGIFSIITLKMQKKQDKVIDKIDQQTAFIEKEKSLKQKLTAKEKECESLIHGIMLMILDTNMYVVLNIAGDDKQYVEGINVTVTDMREKFNHILNEIADIRKEYDMLLELSKDLTPEEKKK